MTSTEHLGRDTYRAYLAGRLPDERARKVREHLDQCGECHQALYGRHEPAQNGRKGSVLQVVGWVLLAGGGLVLTLWPLIRWLGQAETVGIMEAAGLLGGLGLLALAASIGWEQFQEWRSSPYRSVDR